jgi:hypothetical protein
MSEELRSCKVATDPKSQRQRNANVVHQRILCSTSEHERPHRRWSVHGKRFPIVSSAKQKLNTRSSTETEIVGVDHCMPAVLWTRCFMEAQGHGIRENIVFQDNKSAILTEKKGKASSSKRTKHIDIRHYFVTDLQQERSHGGMVSKNRRYDRRPHDKTKSRCSFHQVQRPDHGSHSCERSRPRKGQERLKFF